jgi:N-acetylglucosamine-6-phosphate deacetylase
MLIDIENDIIVSKKYLDESPEGNLYVGPGLVDLQINGFAGVDFNTFPIDELEFLKAIDTLVKEGVTAFFPTVITNSDTSILSLLNNINQLCLQNPIINSFVGGIHLEGPFISPADGAKGAHNHVYIKAPDWNLFEKFQEASGNRIKIITISPEWHNAPDFIKKCVANNVIVSLGHTIASEEQIKAATLAGASMSTHLGNGAPLSLPRNSNFIFEQLANDRLTASIIADGYHLPDSFLKIALKTKQDRAILVSDSTMFAGMKPGVYESHIGGKVFLEDGGRLSTYNNTKILAGSAVSILDCVNKLLKSNLASLSHAWFLASLNPYNLVANVKKERASIKFSDLVVYELNDNTISILNVFKNEKRIYYKSLELNSF